MRTTTYLLAFFALLTACNIPRKMEKVTIKTYEKNDMAPRTFTDAAGPHFTWVSEDLPTSTKPKLLLVHGIMSSSAMWAGNLSGLGKDFELIVPDLIGHGKGTKQWSGNSVDQQVAHLVMILDSLGIKEPVHVVGNSYGGAISANFAEHYPERVRALVIYDGPASDYTVAIADSVARSVGAADLKSLFTPQNPDEQYRLMSMAMYEPPKVPGFARKQLFEHFTTMRPGYLALLQDLLDREDAYATKQYKWTMPTYVIWGEGDRLIPPSVGRSIAARNELPKDHLIMMANAGHVANVEQRDIFEGHLKRILKDGPCPDPAIRAKHENDMCTMEYDPVCGCNGKTYPNACAALREGVKVLSQGECP